jgi:hypothetical protein
VKTAKEIVLSVLFVLLILSAVCLPQLMCNMIETNQTETP